MFQLFTNKRHLDLARTLFKYENTWGVRDKKVFVTIWDRKMHKNRLDEENIGNPLSTLLYLGVLTSRLVLETQDKHWYLSLINIQTINVSKIQGAFYVQTLRYFFRDLLHSRHLQIAENNTLFTDFFLSSWCIKIINMESFVQSS